MRSNISFFTTSNGNQLAYAKYGSDAGMPVFYCHGTPGSRLEITDANKTISKEGLQIVAVDRPGQGLSPFNKNTTILEHAKEMVEMADHLNWEKFSCAGLSGGAASVYALSHVAESRLEIGIDLCGWAPVAEYKELSSLLAPLDRLYLRIARYLPSLFKLSFKAVQYATKSERRLISFIKSSLSVADQEWLAVPANASLFYADVKEAFSQGVEGPAHDAILRYQPWHFDLEAIKPKIHIFAGTEDKFAPLEFAKWKHERIRVSKLTVQEGWGHLNFINHVPQLINKALAEL